MENITRAEFIKKAVDAGIEDDKIKELLNKRREQIGAFADEAPAVREPDEVIPAWKSGIMGAGQGFTANLGDEGAALLTALTKKAQSALPGGAPVDFGEAYRGARGAYRGAFNKARAANPKTYFAGEMAGGAGQMAIPGVGASMTMPKLMALGGLQGFGASEADLTSGNLSDYASAATDTGAGVATAGILGKATPLALKGAAAIAKPVMKGLGWAGKKALSTVFGPSMEAVEQKFARPGQIGEMTPRVPELTARLPGIFKTLQKQISDLDTAAWKTLRTSANEKERAVPVSFLKDELMKLKNSMVIPAGEGASESAIVGSAHQKAAGVMDKFLKDVEGFVPAPPPPPPVVKPDIMGIMPEAVPVAKVLPANISESSMKRLIQAADDNIDWNNPDLGPSNTLLENFRHAIDSRLKTNNPAYEKAMRPVQEKTELFNKAKQYFNLKKDVGAGMLETTQGTEAKVGGLTAKGKTYGQELTEQLPGQNLTKAVEDARLANEFVGGATQGSRRTTPATMIGGGIGHGVGQIVGMPWLGSMAGMGAGAMAGGAIDLQGKKMAGSIIDFYIKHDPARLGKFAAPLAKAASRGAQEVGITHWVLSNTNSEYRQKLKELMNEGTNNE